MCGFGRVPRASKKIPRALQKKLTATRTELKQAVAELKQKVQGLFSSRARARGAQSGLRRQVLGRKMPDSADVPGAKPLIFALKRVRYS